MYYLKNYPLSVIIILIICYLSFFTPPKTELDEVANIDKLVHICMYGGLTMVIWFEYLKNIVRLYGRNLLREESSFL